MKERIVFQMLDTLRGSFSSVEGLEVALLILSWVKLSDAESLPAEMRSSPAILADPKLALETMTQLGNAGLPALEVFRELDRTARQDPSALRTAFELASRLSAAGMLQEFSARDAIDAIELKQSVWRGQESIPEEVTALMVGLAHIHAGDSVYIAWNSGLRLAIDAAELEGRVYFEAPGRSPFPAILNLLSPKQFDIAVDDPITDPSAVAAGGPRKFDIAISCPPFGSRYDADTAKKDWFGRFPEPTTSGMVLAVRHLLWQTSRRVVVAVQNSLLFSTGTELAMRRELLGMGMVEAVIAMPPGLLLQTNIPFAILVLSPAGGHKQVRFINADAPMFRIPVSKAKCQLAHVDDIIAYASAADTNETSISVAVTEVMANDSQLQPSRYVLPASDRKIQELLAGSNVVALRDLVTTVRSIPLATGGDNLATAWEIGASDIPSYSFIATPGREVKIDAQAMLKGDHQFLRPLDIILIVKGSTGKVGIVPQDVPPPGPGGWVAGQSAIILRTDPKGPIDPRALFVQLRSDVGRTLLRSIESGATIPLIQLKELMSLKVLVPDAATSAKAIKALEREAKLQGEIERLQVEQSNAARNLWAV